MSPVGVMMLSLRSQCSHGAICPVDTAPRGEVSPRGVRTFGAQLLIRVIMSTLAEAKTRVVAGLARIDPEGLQDAPPDPRRTPKSAPGGGEGVAISRGFWCPGGEP